MRKNWQYVLLAVIMAVASWYFVTGREKVEVWVTMNVEMTNPPGGLVIRKGMISTVEVRLRGSKGLIRNLESRRLSYPLNVSKLRIGENLIDLDGERIPLSKAIEVVEIKPGRIILSVDKMAEKRVPVVLDWSGQIPADYKLTGKQSMPEEVDIKGPESLVKRVGQARVSIAASFDTAPPQVWEEDATVSLPAEVTGEPGLVRVRLQFSAKLKELWINCPIEVRAPAGMNVSPGVSTVRLLLEGPQGQMRSDDFRKECRAIANVAASLPPGRHSVAYEVVVPEGFRLLRMSPETVPVTIKK